MGKKILHIVSLDIPYPPNRGSVMSIWYAIKALHEEGIDIILHAFYKSFSTPTILTQYCKSVYLYPRQPIWSIQNGVDPLFVQSRRSPELIQLLAQDDAPILFEGLHTMYHFDDLLLKNKRKFVRMHNVESDYYNALRKIESNLFKKIYYRTEADRSRRFEERVLPGANAVFTFSAEEHFKVRKLNPLTYWIPPSIDQSIHFPQGIGSFALFHGDLSVNENENSAIFLIKEVFLNLNFPLIIAGYRPSSKLTRLLSKHPQVTLIDTPTLEKMESLIAAAQIILVPLLHTCGYKMKLLQSLVHGRHIIVSAIGRSYEELSGIVHLADKAAEWKNLILTLKDVPMTQSEIDERAVLIHTVFHNKKNAEQMISILFA